jgi:ectoine hydroxylase-related dioxygenase (phytanoyl-CoA dioxygenase family)
MATTLAFMLTAAEVTRFWDDGFLSVPRLVDDAEVKRLRDAYDDIIEFRVESTTDRNLGGITRQVLVPSMVHPVFDSNRAIDAAREIMRDLFGCATSNRTYDMLIDKPAGHPYDTPWHQDAAYFERPVTKPGFTLPLLSIQFWVALDPVDVDNGCMQFTAGRHRAGTVEHVVVSGHPDDDGRLIGVADPSAVGADGAVAVPLAAGGATFHTALTPHYTGPNLTTDRPRRAYIFNLLAAEEPSDLIQDVVRANYVRDVAEAVERGFAERPRP